MHHNDFKTGGLFHLQASGYRMKLRKLTWTIVSPFPRLALATSWRHPFQASLAIYGGYHKYVARSSFRYDLKDVRKPETVRFCFDSCSCAALKMCILSIVRLA